MTSKKVKIKVKKKKVKVKKLIITILLLIAIFLLASLILKLPIKNIYVKGNNILSDKEIIEMAKISDYPPYLKTYFLNIKSNLLKNKYIKNVKITRKIFNKIYIEIEEYKPICIYKDQLILSSSERVPNKYKIDYVPYIVNDIDSIYEKTIKKFSSIDSEILVKISQIEYAPNKVDDERFIFYMVDSNYVYINLSKIEKINKYNSIIKQLDGKKGIIYLDLGDYIEIKG